MPFPSTAQRVGVGLLLGLLAACSNSSTPKVEGGINPHTPGDAKNRYAPQNGGNVTVFLPLDPEKPKPATPPELEKALAQPPAPTASTSGP